MLVVLLMLPPPLQWLPLQQAGLAGGAILFRRLKLPVPPRRSSSSSRWTRNNKSYDYEPPQTPALLFSSVNGTPFDDDSYGPCAQG
jgi:hypothetical protein